MNKGITAKELIEYLKQFPADEQLGILVANVEARKVYRPLSMDLLHPDDVSFPVIAIVIDSGRDMDEEEIETCEEAEAQQEF